MACKYVVKNSEGVEVTFDTKQEAIKYLRDANAAETSVKGEPVRSTKTLAAVLRQMAFGENNFKPMDLRIFQEELLDEFIRLEEQSQFFYKMGPVVALTKGLGKDFDQMQRVMNNLKELGVGSEEEFDAPIDVRYLLTGNDEYKIYKDQYYHKITANNVRIMNEVNALSRTMFMEQTVSFTNTSDKVVANLKDSLTLDNIRDVKDDLTAYYQIAAYKQWIAVNDKKTSTLRNSLIYDTASASKANETIVDIVKDAAKILPTNTFLQFILPVSTTAKVGKKKTRNINNKDLVNTIEGKTRGKLEPDLVATLMDSFTELYQNPATQYHAKALFDYLLVKDGLMYKNKSFIKMVPTMMFEEISKATDIASELLSLSKREEYSRFIKKVAEMTIYDKLGNKVDYFSNVEKQAFNDLFRNNDLLGIKNKLFEKVFGLNYNQLYNRFEQIYATDAKYQFNLPLIKNKIYVNGNSKKVKGLATFEENGKKYLHVSMFTENFKATEKGSAERAKVFKETMDDLSKAGFNTVELEEGKSNLQFKKYIRMKSAQSAAEIAADMMGLNDAGPKSEYVTYQLVMVERESSTPGKNESLQGDAMTASGELIPRGIYAVYTPVEVVGASNTSGVADLGNRPTKTEILKTINAKTKNDNNTPPPAAPPANPVTPKPTPTAPVATPTETSAGEVTGGMFGGLSQAAFDPNDFFQDGGVEPDAFVSDDDIKQALKNIDKC
jgi:hypothetical protein